MVFMVLSWNGKMVVSRGNAPRSSGYQPGALLLSYKTEVERRPLNADYRLQIANCRMESEKAAFLILKSKICILH